MSFGHDSSGPIDEQAVTGARVHHPGLADGPTPETAPPLVLAADPRLAHAAAAAPGLMALQRSAGNAAVASLVGHPPNVQRMPVEIGEMATNVRVSDAPPAPTGGGGTSGGGTDAGAVTSDGTNTTINGSTITLAAPMTTANGVLHADTIIADTVVASSYSPGAGNVW